MLADWVKLLSKLNCQESLSTLLINTFNPCANWEFLKKNFGPAEELKINEGLGVPNDTLGLVPKHSACNREFISSWFVLMQKII